MDSDRWDRLQDLFHRVVDLGGEGRERFLQIECAGDPEMKRRIVAMLAAEENALSGTLAQAVGTVADQLAGGRGGDAARRIEASLELLDGTQTPNQNLIRLAGRLASEARSPR